MAKLNAKRLQEENNFLAIPKDWKKIVEKILTNEKFLKLLYYKSKDALKLPNLSEAEKERLINKNILSHPYIPSEDEVENYIQILFDNFTQNQVNPQYVDNMIVITLLCHKYTWILEDWNLRLYTMANEVMNMLNNKKLTGIGTVQFVTASAFVPNSSVFGLTMTFMVINSINTKED